MIRITSCPLIHIHHLIHYACITCISENKSLVEHESLATVEVLTETLLNRWKDELDEPKLCLRHSTRRIFRGLRPVGDFVTDGHFSDLVSRRYRQMGGAWTLSIRDTVNTGPEVWRFVVKNTRLPTGETQYAQALYRRIAATLLNKYTNKKHNNFTSIDIQHHDSTRTCILNIGLVSATMLVMVRLILCFI